MILTPFERLLNELNDEQRTYTLQGNEGRLSVNQITKLLDIMDLPIGDYIDEDYDEETDTITLTFR